MSHLTWRGSVQHQSSLCTRCLLRQRIQYAARRRFHMSRGVQQQSVLSLLEERGYINQIAGDQKVLDRILKSRVVGFYAGIDPTAPSLHLGHLLPLMVLFWLHKNGHHVVSLVGGGTSKVGDPSGRLMTRARTAESVLETNSQSMHEQVRKLWTSAVKYGGRYKLSHEKEGRLTVLNNGEWLDNLNILHFLKTMGNGMRLGALLGRDTVKNKMEKGDGMSFSEFTYPLLQAWDWWYMYQKLDVQIQIGGSDQYGNIVAGMDAVKYIAQNSKRPQDQGTWLDRDGKLKDDLSPMGLTVPLLTTSSGEKFGKSAGNAVWLDRNMTSPFDLYGFLLRSTDEDVERYLKLFTFVPITEISSIIKEHKADPGKRKAQHLLATEVLELVHGSEEAVKTRAEHQALRAPTLSSLSRSGQGDLQNATSGENGPGAQRVKLPESLVHNTPFARILYHAGMVKSKSEGARLVSTGGAYVASAPSSSEHDANDEMKFVPVQGQQPSDVASFIANGHLILRAGKWKVRVVEVVKDDVFDAGDSDVPGWAEWKATSSKSP